MFLTLVISSCSRSRAAKEESPRLPCQLPPDNKLPTAALLDAPSPVAAASTLPHLLAEEGPSQPHTDPTAASGMTTWLVHLEPVPMKLIQKFDTLETPYIYNVIANVNYEVIDRSSVCYKYSHLNVGQQFLRV